MIGGEIEFVFSCEALNFSQSWESHQSHSTPAVTRQLRFYSSSTANGAEMFCQVGAVFEEFGLVLGFPMYLLVGLAESRCCSALELQQSSNNCHSHSGFSRMSRQKAWRTCQRPQGFDSCMHKTLARFRSKQETENNSCCREPNWHLPTMTKWKNQDFQ